MKISGVETIWQHEIEMVAYAENWREKAMCRVRHRGGITDADPILHQFNARSSSKYQV